MKDLVLCKTKKAPKKDFKCMFLKPFKKNEVYYKKFLKKFMVTMTVLVKGIQSLVEVFKYLTTYSDKSISEYDFSVFGKVLFHGVIYKNILVQECLNEIDRELNCQTVFLSSSYDSLSENETPQKPELKYNGVKVHNYMLINDGIKSQFVLFLLKTSKFRDIQVTNRKPYTNSDFRELMSNSKADLYGFKYPENKQDPH